MSQLLLYYQRPEPATWVFLSTFLMFGLYFVFHRVWSVRNLDLLLLTLLAPGLMMVYEGRKARMGTVESIAQGAPLAENSLLRPVTREHDPKLPQRESKQLGESLTFVVAKQGVSSLVTQVAARNETPSDRFKLLGTRTIDSEQLEFWGFAALLVACGLLTVRMLVDPALVRRPLLEPNLSIGGLSFIGIALFFFLMGNIVTSNPREESERSPKLGPGYALLNMLPELPTTPEHEGQPWAAPKTGGWEQNLARVLAIVSNMAIVFGIVAVGYWHFDNIKTGIGCATMYLLLPYTAQMTGNVEHALPAALLTLAVLAYRQPLVAGCLLGLAAGLVYYPFFILPLWISFYWQRGLGRLLTGLVAMLILLCSLLLLDGVTSITSHLRQMFGLWIPRMKDLDGIWGGPGMNPEFRLPVLVGFILLSASFAFWPTRKNLGTLICGSAAIMLAAQFWHGYGGGLFMAWFLPLVLLTMFRPNLDDRIGSRVVSPNWRGNGRITMSA